MQKSKQGSLRVVRSTPEQNRAVVFLHGFAGDRDDTWANFPTLLGTHLSNWDIYSLGYATTLQPDVVGVWAADPDLPILSKLFKTQFEVSPLDRYGSVAVLAHSMGGLVAQLAILDNETFRGRLSHLVLFGTPSGGLRKASWGRIWKRQLRNMDRNGSFIRDLRQRWRKQFEGGIPFELAVVAGASDQFVPSNSSLAPFPGQHHYVVRGDHLSMVKPTSPDQDTVRLVLELLTREAPPASEAQSRILLAGQRPVQEQTLSELIEDLGNDPTEEAIVALALAYERRLNRSEATQLLERYSALGTDVRGTLAGRIKRLWMEDEKEEYASRSLDLYEHALTQAIEENNTEQIYYHAINVAFWNFVVFDRPDVVQEKALLAVSRAGLAEDSVWGLATRAEAALYLRDLNAAVKLYKQALGQDIEPWQLASAGQQAMQVAAKLADVELMEALDKLFSGGSRRVSKIFVSYSHEDKQWMERLEKHTKPFLRDEEVELVFWTDVNQITAGDKWHERIQHTLATSGVAIAVVSANFLASDYIMHHELPEMLKAASSGDLRLLWIHVSPAAYKVTKLKDFQAAHDVTQPLSGLSWHEQEIVLLHVAEEMKGAALSAVERFVSAPYIP